MDAKDPILLGCPSTFRLYTGPQGTTAGGTEDVLGPPVKNGRGLRSRQTLVDS